MHKILVLCFLLLANLLVGQSPQKISYQGVARSASGAVLSNTTIAVKFDIRDSPAGTIIFSEQHQGSTALTTNAFGLFTTAIGSINSLGGIDWSNGPFFIEVSIDPANGTSYNSVGTQELMSVPYALYAEKAGNATPIPTITVNAPNTITNLSAGSYSIHIPSSASYTAGNGIDISNGIISTTLSATSPTITGSGQATVTSSSFNKYDVHVPTPTLSVSGNSISINPGNMQILPENTITAGNPNLTISKVGYDYTLTPVVPSLSVVGGTLTGAYPTQTLTIPASAVGLVAGDHVILNQSGNTYTLSSVSPTLQVNGGTLTGAYPSQTLTIPASSTTSLAAGNSNITLNQSGNNYTITPVTPTLNVNGGTLTGAYPSQTLTIPSSSTTLVSGNNVSLNQNGSTYTVNASTTSLAAGNSNITLNQSGNNYTITPVTPTLNVNGGTLTGAYPSQTLTIPASATTSLSAGNSNITLTQSGNNYTITPVTPTLNVNGATLTGSYPSQTLTIPGSSTTLVPGNNISLNQSGNTYTISSASPALTAGANVTITPTGPANAYTISAGVATYTGTSGNIAVSGNTINLVTTGVTAGAYGSAAGNVVPFFSVDPFGRLSSAGEYTPTISGDVTGALNVSVVSKIRGVPIAATAPVNGQVLQYNGSAWTPAAIATPWSLSGNAGTTASNFIGTTDNVPFRIRTNNTVKAVFTENGQLLVGNASGYGASSKLVVLDGHIESMQTTAPLIAGAGSLLGLAGSSASLSSNSTDVRGTISIYTGLLGGGGKGNYATITFDKPYANPPVVILTPRSEDSAGLRAYVTGTSTTGFTIAFSTGTAGLTTYEFNYMILE